MSRFLGGRLAAYRAMTGDGQDSKEGPDSLLDEFSLAADGREEDAVQALKRVLHRNVHPSSALGDRYTLVRELGVGGMGSVWLGWDDRLNRSVAIKRLFRQTSDALARFSREARAVGRLNHPHIVSIFDVATDEGEPYIVMEYVRGSSLDQWQRERDWHDVLDVYLQAGEGLTAAHEVGLVHRDFKPHNVIVQEDGSADWTAKVLDFGLARSQSVSTLVTSSESGGSVDGPPLGALTEQGAVIGTPAYMAPEQFNDAQVGPEADQFSFCVALWQGLYGERPFAGRSIPEVLREILSGRVRKVPADTDVPDAIRRVLVTGLAAAPSNRYRSLRALLAALRTATRSRSPWPSVAAGAGVLGVLAMVAWPRADSIDRCETEAAKVDAVWGERPRAAFEDALTKNASARLVEVTLGEIDRYADAWREQQHEACTATLVTGEQSEETWKQRRQCLRGGLDHLERVVDILARGTEVTPDRALAILSVLPPLSQCSDLEQLSSATVSPPPAARRTVDTVRTRLISARIERRADRHDEARRLVEDTQVLIEDLDYGPAKARVALEDGRVRTALAQLDAAEESLRTALREATRALDWPTTIEAAAELLVLVGVHKRHIEDALAYELMASGFVERARYSEPRFRYSAGRVFEEAERFSEAQREYERGIESIRELGHPDQQTLLAAHRGLARVLQRQGLSEAADAALSELRALEGRLLIGPDQPNPQ